MICVLCPYDIDTGLISKAVSLAEGKPVRVIVPEKDTAGAAAVGASIIHSLSHAPIDEGSFALWLKEKLTEWDCTIALAPATVQMRNLMPMLAWYMNAGLTADCTDLSVEEGKLL